MHPRILQSVLTPAEINQWHAYITRKREEQEKHDRAARAARRR